MSFSADKFIRSFFDAWNRHESEALKSMYHIDAVMEDPMLPEPVRGRAAILDYYRRSFAATPNAEHHLIRHSSADQCIFFEWDYIVDGRALSGEPSRVATFGSSIFTLRDGLVIRDTSYWDPRRFESEVRGGPLQGRRVLVLAGPLYEDIELHYPLIRLKEAGAEVVVAGLEEKIYRGKFASLALAAKGRAVIPGVSQPVFKGVNGMMIPADCTVGSVDPATIDAVVVPGGYAPDHFRRSEDVLNLLRAMNEQGRLIATICHGGWVLASAGIARGRKLTSLYAIESDMRNAGCEYADQPVVIDGNLITSRHPDDLPQFCTAIIEWLRKAPQRR
jgi:protease I